MFTLLFTSVWCDIRHLVYQKRFSCVSVHYFLSDMCSLTRLGSDSSIWIPCVSSAFQILGQIGYEDMPHLFELTPKKNMKRKKIFRIFCAIAHKFTNNSLEKELSISSDTSSCASGCTWKCLWLKLPQNSNNLNLFSFVSWCVILLGPSSCFAPTP